MAALLYGVGTSRPAVWASASVGLTSALIVCTILHRRSESTATTIDHDAARWRNTITTRNLAMAGI